METRSVETRPWGDSLATILVLLLRLNQDPRARMLLQKVRRRFPFDLVKKVEWHMEQGPDLALVPDEPARGREAPVIDGSDPADTTNSEDEPPCEPVLHRSQPARC